MSAVIKKRGQEGARRQIINNSLNKPKCIASQHTQEFMSNRIILFFHKAMAKQLQWITENLPTDTYYYGSHQK